jgi:hypothetical protein
MTPSRATNFTPFFMVYGSEVVLSTDLDYGTPRVRAHNKQGAEAFLEDVMDQLDEARDVGLLRSTKYQQALRRYHGRRVRGRAFNVGDLLLRLVQSNKDRHKLSPPWEGPFISAEVLRLGSYKLQTPDGEVFTNSWNIEQLRLFSLCHSLVPLDPSHGRGSGITRGLPRPYPLKTPYAQPNPTIGAKRYKLRRSRL